MAIGRRWLVLLLVPVLVLFSYCGMGDALPTGLTAPSDEHLRGYTSRLDRLEARLGRIEGKHMKAMELQGNHLLQLQALLDIQKGYKDFRPIPSLVEDKIPQIHETCQDAYRNGWTTSGIYTIMPDGSTKFNIYCKFGKDRRDFRPSSTMNIAKVFRNCTDAYEQGWMQSGLYTILANGTETTDVFCEQGRNGDSKPVRFFKSCMDAYEHGQSQSGMYYIPIGDTQIMPVLCEQQLDGGGWEVFQQRLDGSIDFFRGWLEYQNGFGNISARGEYWLGLEAIHQLTKDQTKKLKVELTFPNGAVYRMDYSTFWLEDSSQSYRLHVSGFTGPSSHGGDRLDYHNLQQFTTKDHDRDKDSGNCAVSHHGAWWYKSCSGSNLNGGYGVSGCKGFTWNDNNGLSGSRMMIKLR